MTTVKRANRCATTAFSPNAPFIATGTMAGAIDLSFSTTACLEIFETNYASDDLDMPVVGRAVPATERFHRLVWGTCGTETSEEMRLGVIAGGLVDGTVNVYNPAKIVDGAQSGAIITKLAKHQGAVRGLDFNSFSPNLLASGAEDGELCIWDLANPTKPSLYPALKSGSGGPTAGEVSSLAWNHKVQHILASSSLSGTTVVWDLKRQRPVISFTDPNSRRRCSALQWNPEVATQLIVASDDDRSCSLQVWDLRNSISPAREFVAHSKGVLAMAWNLQDPSLLLTCGKDNRTLCWDTEAGEVISELPASSNWNFDVQWSKTTPGILSTSSFDGKITLHNMQQASAPQAGGQAHGVASDFSGLSHAQNAGPKVAMKRAPEWMKRPCGATFGFGGKLIAHGASLSGVVSSPTAISVISVKSDSSEPGVADEVRGEFEKVIKSGETDELINFCNTKRAEALSDDKEAWTFMSILFTEDARREMLRHLEFGDALEAREKSMAALSLNDTSTGDDADEQDTASSVPTSPTQLTPVEDNDAFFENLGDEAPKPPAPKVLPKPKLSPVKSTPAPPARAPPTEAADFEIQRALIVGDYRAAVAACEKAARYADALILAAAGGPELWAEAQAAHIARVPRPYMQVAAAVVGKNLSNLVKARPVSAWRETLAMLCTYAPGEEWGPLAEVLAEGLAASGDHRAAMLCHICAGNVDAAITYWLSSLPSRNFSPKDLYDVVEKAVMLTRAAGQTESTQGFTSLITNYAEMLSSQGDLDHALDYLGMVPGVPGEEVNVLRNRIIRSGISNPASTSAPATPPKPAPQPAPYQQQQQTYQQPQQPQYQSPYAQSPQANAYSGQTTSYGAPPPQVPQRAPQPTPMMPSAYTPQQDVHSPYGGMPQQSAYGAPPPPAQAPAPQQPPPPPPRQTAYDSAPVQSAYAAQTSYSSAPGPSQPLSGGMGGSYSAAAAVAAGTMGVTQQAYGAGPPQPPQAAPMMPGMMVPTPMQSQQQSYQHGAMGGGPPSQQQQRAPPPPPTATAQAAMFNPTPSAPPPSIPQRPTEPPAYGSSTPPPPPSQSYSSAPPPPQQQSVYAQAPPQQPAFSPQAPMPMTPTPQALAPSQPQPQQVAPPKPAAPAKPQPPSNCTMETVDTSNVTGELAMVVRSLKAMYDVCAQAAGANPAKRKEMEDSSKRLAVLLFKANIGDVSTSVMEKLKSLAQSLDMADYQSAQNIQMALTTGDWDECSFWLTAMKRLLKFRSTLP